MSTATINAAFDDFDPARVARYTARRVEKLLADPGIVRNRLKVESAVSNARAFIEVQQEFGSFDAYLADRVPPPPARLPPDAVAGSIPATTPASDALSADLKRRGFRFVGSTIVYAFMQSVGLVDDQYVVNPTFEQRKKSKIDLVVAGSADGIVQNPAYGAP